MVRDSRRPVRLVGAAPLSGGRSWQIDGSSREARSRSRWRGWLGAILTLLFVGSSLPIPGLGPSDVSAAPPCTPTKFIVALDQAGQIDSSARTYFKASAANNSNTVCTSWSGNVTFSSNDPLMEWTFWSVNPVAASGGVARTSFVPHTAGSITVTATSGSLTGSATFPVGQTTIALSMPATVQAGVATDVTISAISAWTGEPSPYYDSFLALHTGDPAAEWYETKPTMDPDIPAWDGATSGGDLVTEIGYQSPSSGTITYKTLFFAPGSRSVWGLDPSLYPATPSAPIDVTVLPTTLVVGPPTGAIAGGDTSVRVEARNEAGQALSGFEAQIRLTTSDSTGSVTAPNPYRFQPGDGGAHDYTVRLNTLGNQTLTATSVKYAAMTASATTTVSDASFTLSIAPWYAGGTAIRAGEPAEVTVTAGTPADPLTTYRGTIALSSSDTGAAFEGLDAQGEYAFTAADAGVHVFRVRFANSGSQSVTATDVDNPGLVGIGAISVAETYLVIESYPTTQPAKTEQAFVVCASKTAGSCAASDILYDFEGTVGISSSDSNLIKGPGLATDGTYAFTGRGAEYVTGTPDPSADRSRHWFYPSHLAAGTYTITFSDTRKASRTASANVTITTAPSAASGFEVSVAPSRVDRSAPASTSVRAMAAAASTTCTLNARTTIDVVSYCPRNVPFSESTTDQSTGNPTLRTTGEFVLASNVAGAMTITTTQPTGQKTAIPTSIWVDDVQVATLALGSTNNTATKTQTVPGIPTTGIHTVKILATGSIASPLQVTRLVYVPTAAYGFTGYAGTVRLTSDPTGATFAGAPAGTYTFTGAGAATDNGRHAFPTTFPGPGTYAITATDTVTASITSRPSSVYVSDLHFDVVLSEANPYAGQALTYTVTARRASGAVATDYRGTIDITRNDGAPTSYTFTAEDAGLATMPITWPTAGPKWIRVADRVDPDTSTGRLDVTVFEDNRPPVVDFARPEEATTTSQYATAYTVRWTEAEGESPIAARSLQRQRGAIASVGTCTGVTWTDDGAPVTNASPVLVEGLADGFCYRWVETLTSSTGISAISTSGSVLLDRTGPALTAIAPAADVLQRSSNLTVSWAEADTGSGVATRTVQRQRGVPLEPGTCTGVEWQPDGPASSAAAPLEEGALASGWCYRWSIRLRDAAGNETLLPTGLVMIDADDPAASWLSPAGTPAVAHGSSAIELDWTAADVVAGIASAVVQRQENAPDVGVCPTVGWANVGPEMVAEPPLQVNGLLASTCYRWRLTVTDAAGNSTAAVSPVVLTSSALVDSSPPGDTIFEVEPVTASLAAPASAASVEVLVDGNPVGADTTVPYSLDWDTSGIADGSHELRIRVNLEAGGTELSAPVGIVVNNALPSVDRVLADVAKGRLTVDERALYGVYALGSVWSLPPRYQSTTPSSIVVTADAFIDDFSLLSPATQAEISAFIDQPLRGDLYQPPPGTPSGTLNPYWEECSQNEPGALVSCQHLSSQGHFRFYYSQPDPDVDDDVTSDDFIGADLQAGQNHVPDSLDKLAFEMELARTVYLDLGYRPIADPQPVQMERCPFLGGDCARKLFFLLPTDIFVSPDTQRPFYVARHELFHAFQYEYDPGGIIRVGPFKYESPLAFWHEATAEWASHEMNEPARQDFNYTSNLADYLKAPERELSTWDDNERQYGVFLFAGYLQKRFDAAFLRELWERIDADRSFAEALADVLVNRPGSPTLESVLRDYAQAAYRMDFATDRDFTNWRERLIPVAELQGDSLNPNPRTRVRVPVTEGTAVDQSVTVEGGGFQAIEFVTPDGVPGSLKVEVFESAPYLVAPVVLTMAEYPAGFTAPDGPVPGVCRSNVLDFGPTPPPEPEPGPAPDAPDRGHLESIAAVDASCPYVSLILSHGLPDGTEKAIRYRATFSTATTRVSVRSSGYQGVASSIEPSLSADGRYVVFSSLAALAPGDTNSGWDVYVHDRNTRQTSLVSLDSSGQQSAWWSFANAISPDGRYVAFESAAPDLVSGDTNGTEDVFVRDLLAGTTIRASLGDAGGEGDYSSTDASISGDARYVVFVSDAHNLVSNEDPDNSYWHNIYLRDTVAGTTTAISVDPSGALGGNSYDPKITPDGRYVVFYSFANLTADDTGVAGDVFVYDRTTGTTTRVSVSSAGAEGNGQSYFPSISADGRWVAFASEATNLVGDDTNDAPDVFLRDRVLGVTTRVSVDSSGNDANGASSTSWVQASLSDDARYVVFQSDATDLVDGDTNGATDIFLRDVLSGATVRISVDAFDRQAATSSFNAAISADGSYIAFQSQSAIVVSDSNDAQDIYVRRR